MNRDDPRTPEWVRQQFRELIEKWRKQAATLTQCADDLELSLELYLELYYAKQRSAK